MARSGYLRDDLLVGRGLELVGGHVAKGAVQAVPLNQAMYSTVAWRAAARVGQGWWSRHSPFREAKNDSASALSQHWPVRPVDRQTARSSARVASSPLLYWQPLSEWNTTPARDHGRRPR